MQFPNGPTSVQSQARSDSKRGLKSCKSSPKASKASCPVNLRTVVCPRFFIALVSTKSYQGAALRHAYQQFRMRDVPYPDFFHLQAAVGWLTLGNSEEARREFNRLAQPYETHPDYLHVRCRLLIVDREWPAALLVGQQQIDLAPERPHGWLHHAYCLHELNRTQEAFRILRRAVRRFPKHHLITFNLACYCCHLARFREALMWVNRTVELVEKPVA